MAALAEFIQDGVRYVPTKAIAKSVGLSPRYLADFCRDGRVTAIFHKGAWYVEENSLRAFLEKQARERAEYNRRLSEEAKQEVERHKAEQAPALPPPAAPLRVHRKPAEALLATLTLFAVMASGAFAFYDIAPDTVAQLRDIPSKANQQLAAISSLPWLDNFADTLFRTVCPILRDCPRTDVIVEPTTQQLPQRVPQPAATSSRTMQPRVVTQQPVQQAVTNQPVIERIREVQTPGINAAYVDTRIAALGASLQRQFDAMADANATSFRSVSQSSGASSPTSVAASIITGTITNAIDSAIGEFLDITTNTLTATNASTTNLTVSATTTTRGLKVTALDCSSLGNGGTLTTDASGNVVCAADDGGSGSVGGSDILGVSRGGTGWGAIQSGALVLGNGTGAVATTSAGTNGQVLALVGGTPTWVATTTFSSGLTYSGGNVTLDATGNWSGTFDGLDGSSYLGNSFSTTSASYFSSLGLAFATTSADAWKSANNFFSTTSASYFSSLGLAFSTTSASYFLAKNQGAGFSTTSAMYFAHSSTTIPKAYSDNTWTGSQIFSGSILSLGAAQFANSSNFLGLTSFGATGTTTIATNGTISTPSIIANAASAFQASFGATATSTFSSTGALTLAGGLNGPLHSNNGLVAATTSIGVLYGGTGLTSAPAYGQVLVGNSSGGYTLTATSSLGITGGSSLFTDGGNTTYLTSGDVLGVGTTTALSKLAVYGDLFVEGSSRYLNFGTATGTSGYGFRDNAGTLEFKNSGGTWQGVTTATSGPSFSVHRNSVNTSALTAGQFTLIDWTTEAFDTNNNFDLSTDRFQPTVPGKYIISGAAHFNSTGTDGESLIVSIHKNGSRSAEGVKRRASVNGENVTVSAVIDLNGTSDYVELRALPEASSVVLVGESFLTYFTGALIAPVNATAGGWQNDGTQSFLADSTDKVGIGTSTPWAKLSIDAPAGVNSFAIGSSTATYFLVNSSGNVGIGTTSPWKSLSVDSTAVFNNTVSFTGSNFTSGPSISNQGDGLLLVGGTTAGVRFNNQDNSAELMRITNSGDVRIGGATVLQGKTTINYNGTSNQGLNINDTAGHSAVGHMLFLSNGSTVGSVSGNTTNVTYNTSSDRRVKENIATTTLGLDALMRLSVRDFSFKSDGTHAVTTGFIAQELYDVFPWAVTTNGDDGITPLGASSTPWSVDYGRMTPLLAKAIQDLNHKLEDLATTNASTTDQSSFTSRFFASLFARLTQWFADTTNGITDFFAKIGHFDEVCAKNSDGTETCVDGDQLKSLLGSGAAGAATAGSGETAGTSGGLPASGGGDAGTATTTPPVDPPPSGEPPASASSSPDTIEQDEPEETPPDVSPPENGVEPLPEAANDNQPMVELPATGTD